MTLNLNSFNFIPDGARAQHFHRVKDAFTAHSVCFNRCPAAFNQQSPIAINLSLRDN